MDQIIPKEYYLETPANYDDIHTKSQFTTVVKLFGIKQLANGISPVLSLFKGKEHKEISDDIFMYLLDTEDYDVFDKANEDKFIKRYILSLFEAGYFG